MRHVWSIVVGLAVLAAASAIVAVPASAQNPVPPKAGQALELQGKIVKTGPQQIVVETRDKKQVAVKVHPKTKIMQKDKVVAVTDLRVGTSITVAYVTEADVFLANTVTIVEDLPVVDATVIDGEIIRVVDREQVIVRTSVGREVIVFVHPKTVLELNGKVVQVTDLRPGTQVNVAFDVRDKRNMAQHIKSAPPRK